MSETNPCKCATPSVGPTKSTASSFSFQVCDGMELVSVPASDIADYIINVIYGDTEGAPPDEGCYNVCFDENGNRSISLVSEETPSDSYTLLTEYPIFPNTPEDPDGQASWGTASTVLPLIQPPSGYIPSHVKLRIYHKINGSDKVNEFRDINGNRVFFQRAEGSDDDHSSVVDVLVPVQEDGGVYSVYLTGSTPSGTGNIKQIGYERISTFDENGDVVPPVDGGTPPVVEEPEVVPAPLNITYLSHVYDISGADTTIIEWFIDNDLTGGDSYTIAFDLGETIHTEVIPHVVGLTSVKQRLTINWTSLNTLKLDAIVQETGSSNYGVAVTSQFGTSDPTIAGAYITPPITVA